MGLRINLASLARVTPQANTPPWSLKTMTVCLLLGNIILPLGLSLLLPYLFPALSRSTLFFLIQLSIFPIWLGIFLFLKLHYHAAMRFFLGLCCEKPWSYYLRQGIYVVLSIGSLVVLLSELTVWFHFHPQDPYEQLPREQIKMIAFFAVLTAPLVEETVFRGFVQTTLSKYTSPVAEVLVTAILFALFHGSYWQSPFALTYVFLLGLTLSFFRRRTGSILPGMMGHLFNNLLAGWVNLS